MYCYVLSWVASFFLYSRPIFMIQIVYLTAFVFDFLGDPAWCFGHGFCMVHLTSKSALYDETNDTYFDLLPFCIISKNPEAIKPNNLGLVSN